MLRVQLMCLLLAGGGWQVSRIVEHGAGTMSYVAASMCFGCSLYALASAVRWP